MKDKFTRIAFKKTFNVTSLISLLYVELAKSFSSPGESHDFWEMVYVDKGEIICTADSRSFLLKSGEIIFHKPNEYHMHCGNMTTDSNLSILSFECKSLAMKHFENKIIRLNAEEKNFLSMLFAEGLSLFRLEDENNPLLIKMNYLESAPYGCSQMTKNLLEMFLIKVSRNSDTVFQKHRETFSLDNMDVPDQLKEILDYLQSNIYGKVTIADIAAHVNKSESSVKRLFATWKKIGLIEYYNSLKIKEAKKLLRENIYNISQIASMLCFDSSQYFSKCFKRFTNKTPSEYKASIIR